MTREQAREATVDTWDLDYQIGVMQAFKARRQIEFRFRDTFSKAWHVSVFPNWNWQHLEYRIKPTAKLRPWTADEVPLGAWMRYKRALHDRSILAWTSNQADRDMWLDEREYSTDGGKTWLPCGVMEESK